jgi:tetratricopeptide (TPR) repeat protein
MPGDVATAAFSRPAFEPEFVARMERFRLEPTLVAAADVVEAAVVLGQDREAVAAARAILRGGRAVPLVRQQAAALLQRTGNAEEIASDPDPAVAQRTDTAFVSPSAWRGRARLNPTDAAPWVELARQQLCNGHVVAARRSINVALHLAPTNRHVLRAAARLFFHLREFDRAHDLLRRSEATPHDPWLMAAEIALSSFSERTPLFWKPGLRLAESERLPPAQITELAGALGTQMMVDGGGRAARKMMRLSQLAPTENAVAQAEWVAVNLDSTVLAPNALRTSSRAWEALSMHAFYGEGDFRAAMAHAERWIEDEPYNPLAYAAIAVSANLLEEFEAALYWSGRGLAVSEAFGSLLNTRAFALASTGDLGGAEASLAQLREEEGDTQSLVAAANRGLIACRRGQLAAGRDLYRRAISGFKKAGHSELEAAALAYMAAELVRVGALSDAERAFRDAETVHRTLRRRNVQVVIDRVRHLLDRARRGDLPVPAG